MASFLYDKARESFLGIPSGSINWLNDVIKATLVSSSYVPNQSAHQYVDPSLLAHTGTWTPQTLVNKTSTSGQAYADNITFLTVPAPYTIDYVAIFKESGTSNKSQWQLIALLDRANIAGLPLTGSGADILINWNTGLNKIFKL